MEDTRIATPFAPTGIPGSKVEGRIRMNIVIVGHVDHGKSTVVGRLLADTGSLPDGKLDSVRAFCERNSRPFEYAFLLDALKDEQAQGITIDTARTFFKSGKRDYIIIDAPGHIEFLKNMVTGAARAESAVLVIDAKEGIRENSKRHGYLLSMLGIKQIAVVVNKMDLVDYSKTAFEDIRDEYIAFLARIGATPKFFIPISAFNGENLIAPSDKMPWYKGHDLLSAMDAFEKEPPKANQPFRMPIQDIYKFTSLGDDRRIVSGRVESGFRPGGRSRGVPAFGQEEPHRLHRGLPRPAPHGGGRRRFHRLHPGGADLRGPRRTHGQGQRGPRRGLAPSAHQPVLDGQEALHPRQDLLPEAGHGQGPLPPGEDQLSRRRFRVGRSDQDRGGTP